MNSPSTIPGAVIGIGTDIIECARIGRMIDRHGEIFLSRVYTPAEISYCSHRKAAVQHYAGRWAAKEAALKAIGTGWTRGIEWTDIEVCNDPGGKPRIVLAGQAAVICKQQGIRELMISITHCRSHAVAFVTAVS